MEFSNVEYADMHLMYGMASCNSLEARRLYQQRYPNRRVPDRKTFERVDQRLRETGKFSVNSANRGAPRIARTVEVEENILNMVAVNPSTSVRSISSQLNISKSTTGKILQQELLHPFHLQKVHALSPHDFPARLQFSQWYLDNYERNHTFIRSILFTDEAGFGRNGVINSHNLHVWADENPHATIEARHQRNFQINVWAGIIGPYLVGPFVLPQRLNGQLYYEFLLNELPHLLENVDLETRRNMWFMNDGAPPHFSIIVREHLNNVFPNRWIGRGGPVPWPPRSPDLNPLDFFLWGYLKNLVYATPIDTREELHNRIMYYCNEIKTNQEMLWRVLQSSVKRARACIREEGVHIEHLI